MIVKVCKDLCTNLGSLLGISYDVIKEQFIYVSVDEELNGTEGSREREGSLKVGFKNNLCAALIVQHVLLIALGGCTAAGDF